MGGRPWIARATPERVAALKGEKCLWDVRLCEDDTACCAERRDDLYSMGRSVRGVFAAYGGVAKTKRTAASCSAGLLAHCVYPIVLSNPFTLTILTSLTPSTWKRNESGRKRTLVLHANRHTMQWPLQATRRSKLVVQLTSILFGLFKEHYSSRAPDKSPPLSLRPSSDSRDTSGTYLQ